MTTPSGSDPHFGRVTLLSILTVVGDILVISLLLLPLWLGIVTAAPGTTAALEARRRVDLDGPSTPARTMLQGTRRHFRSLWWFGPIMLATGALAWIGVAFWLTVAQPLGAIMLAVVLVVAAVAALLALTVPVAAISTTGARGMLERGAGLAAKRPFISMLALAAVAAAWVMAAWLPTVGIVAIGAVVVEISWRAWGRDDSPPR